MTLDTVLPLRPTRWVQSRTVDRRCPRPCRSPVTQASVREAAPSEWNLTSKCFLPARPPHVAWQATAAGPKIGAPILYLSVYICWLPWKTQTLSANWHQFWSEKDIWFREDDANPAEVFNQIKFHYEMKILMTINGLKQIVFCWKFPDWKRFSGKAVKARSKLWILVPISFLVVVTKAGSDCCRQPVKTLSNNKEHRKLPKTNRSRDHFWWRKSWLGLS